MKQRQLIVAFLCMELLAGVLYIAGCGTNTTTNPALKYGADDFVPNYYASLQATYWWASFPVKYAIIHDGEYAGMSSNFVNRTIEGLESWRSNTDGVITFLQTDDPANAKITLRFETHYGVPGPFDSDGGRTNLTYGADSLQLKKAEIVIVYWTGLAYNDALIRMVAAHEMGHALGMAGHSPNADDVMYWQPNTANPPVPTTSDVNTIKTLYAHLWLALAAPPAMQPETGSLRQRTIE